MAKKPDQWWDRCFNPVTGCTPISEGCDHCWAQAYLRRFGERPPSVKCHEDRLSGPYAEERLRGEGKRIFVCNTGDLFHSDVLLGFCVRVFMVIQNTPQHTFFVLTKRAAAMAEGFRLPDVANLYPHVYFGVSVETQARADERLPHLMAMPVARKFVSVEPMLGPVYFDPVGLDWVVCGAETGPGARPFDPDWARAIRDVCWCWGVPFWFKSTGRGVEIPEDLLVREEPR